MRIGCQTPSRSFVLQYDFDGGRKLVWRKTSTINEGDDMSDETVFILPEGYRFDLPEGRDFERDTFCDPYKKGKNDKIWLIHDVDRSGVYLFSFDLKKVYEFWSDYPDNLTAEQKAIFEKIIQLQQG